MLARQRTKEGGRVAAATARDLLRATLHMKWPTRVDTVNLGERLLLRRAGSAECVPARFIPGASDSLTKLHGFTEDGERMVGYARGGDTSRRT